MKSIAFLVAFVAATAAHAGTIVGVVKASAPALPAGEQGGDGYDSRRLKLAEKVDYDHLVDFVVYIDEPGPIGSVPASIPTTTPAVTAQKDANFDPHVLPIMVGTKVRWPNLDEIYHNVFSTSDAGPFDLGFYKSEKVPEVPFTKVGRVDVFCAIHTKMHCIILVLPNPYFAKADAKGRFTISNVPAGTYKLRAWHERLPSKVQEIVVPAEGEVKMDFTLTVTALPTY